MTAFLRSSSFPIFCEAYESPLHCLIDSVKPAAVRALSLVPFLLSKKKKKVFILMRGCKPAGARFLGGKVNGVFFEGGGRRL